MNAKRGCQVEVGRLISHPCGQKAKRTCSVCGKRICKRHSDAEGSCVQCTGEYVPSEALVRVGREMFDFSEEEVDLFEQSAGAEDQPPRHS